eukprot:m.212194 g.212194  ORF g.212194 m.212194 type:complete len:1174 (-) comp15071_c0_seq8:2900-6421(-)
MASLQPPPTIQRKLSSEHCTAPPLVHEFTESLHDWNPATATSRKHVFERADSLSGWLKRKKGFSCVSCHLWVAYLGDQAHSYAPCQPSFTRVTEYPPRDDPVTHHHWVAGTFDKSKSCSFCSKSLGSKKLSKSSRALRCAWCKRYLHEHCLKDKADSFGICDLGYYAPIVLGASDILVAPQGHNSGTELSKLGQSLTAEDLSVMETTGRGAQRLYSGTVQDTSQVARSNSLGALSVRTPIVSDWEADDGASTGLEEADDADQAAVGTQFGVDSLELDAVRRLSAAQRKTYAHNVKSARRRSLKAKKQHMSALRRVTADITTASRFLIRPTDDTKLPLVVLINPKSGGNQGAKLLQQFLWYLNPRQVFNIMEQDANGAPVGPKAALKIYHSTPNLRLLVCGGDGTVGWALETIDQMGLGSKNIPVGTIPLGTGNDLARSLKMGPGYEGESVKKLLARVLGCVVAKLDRWSLKFSVNPNPEVDLVALAAHYDVPIVNELPLAVFNNYFSFGADAWATLAFHLARERDPSKFQSRITNKAYYGFQGAKDIFVHKFKNLPDMTDIWCDDVHLTPIVKHKKLEVIVFLNISSYGAGTKPWGTKEAVDGFVAPSMEDGLLEVIGFTSAFALAKGVMRVGHGIRLMQCKSARIAMHAPIPVQVDGEPCMIAPGEIQLDLKNQASVLCRPKGRYLKGLQADIHAPAFPVGLHIGDDDEDDGFDAGSGRASPNIEHKRYASVGAVQERSRHATYARSKSVGKEPHFDSSSPAVASAVRRLAKFASQGDSRTVFTFDSQSSLTSEQSVSSLPDAPNPAVRAVPSAYQKGGEASGITSRFASSSTLALDDLPASPSAVPLSPSTDGTATASSRHSIGFQLPGPVFSDDAPAMQVSTQQEPQSPPSAQYPQKVKAKEGEQEAGTKPIVSTDTPQQRVESTPITFNLYLVPLEDGSRTGALRDMGFISIPRDMSFQSLRRFISRRFPSISFSGTSKWRFLKFNHITRVYATIPRKMQGDYRVKEFISQEHVKPGVFICNMDLPNDAEALFAAVKSGSLSTLDSTLSGTNVSPSAVDNTGTTALHMAVHYPSLTVLVDLLKNKKLDPNLPDLCGRTPLHYAALAGFVKGVQTLRAAGANDDIIDCTGCTPSQLARLADQESIACLIETGALASPTLSQTSTGIESVV